MIKQLICLHITQVKDKAYLLRVWFTAQRANEIHNEWMRRKDFQSGPGLALNGLYTVCVKAITSASGFEIEGLI